MKRYTGGGVRYTPEEIAERHRITTEAWGMERKPFEGDGVYLARVASHWKERAERAERELRVLTNEPPLCPSCRAGDGEGECLCDEVDS